MNVTDTGTRYEVEVDGAVVGYAEYEREGDAVVFTHTVVNPASQGRGVATALVEQAVADVRGRGLEVVAQCAFVKAWLAREAA